MLVEVWSFSEGQMVGRLDLPRHCQRARNPSSRSSRRKRLLVVYARGNGPPAPPVCQIWNFVHDEMLAEFVATGSSGDPKNQWAISPGRRYFATADKSLLRVYDLAEKQLVGKASVPAVPAQLAFGLCRSRVHSRRPTGDGHISWR